MLKSLITPISFAALLVLSACNQRPEEVGSPVNIDPDTAEEASDDGTVSILRPEVVAPEAEAATLSALEAVIAFPDGGKALDADAVAELERVLMSPQMKFSGPIILRAHSDSDGTDAANEDASEARGLAVAAWLIGQGVDEDRVEVIVFGEQNPAKPNALPDGSPNEEGRKANRRVEIEVQMPPESESADSEAIDDTSVESSD